MSGRRNDLTEHDQILEEGHLEMIERLRILWSNTSNPVYVWRAINHCSVIGMLRERGRTGQVPQPPWTDPYPFPDWCLGYLTTVAARIATLSDGQDYRPYPMPIGDAEPSPDAFREAHEQPADMTGKRAADLVVTALGIKRQGTNAFDAAASLQAKELDTLAFDDLRNIHTSPGAAMEALLSEAGVTDERSMRKRLAEAERANDPKIGGSARVKPGG